MTSYLADLIIVNFNTRRFLADCLKSLREFSGPFSNYQVWVIDNNSTDGSRQLIKTLGWVKAIFNQKNRGYGAACNQGIQNGSGKFIFLLNSDLQFTPNWLPPLLNMLESSSGIAVVGPRLVNPRGLLVGVGVIGKNAEPEIQGWGEPNEPKCYNQPLECLSVSGACLGIKRELLPRLGLFDEHYFHYFEETDYCYNARFHGYKVMYCPNSTVIHQVYGSCQRTELLSKYYQASRAYFEQKWHDFLSDETEY